MSLANLETSERKVRSQNGEDGVLEAIFAEIGVTNRYVVEFGAGDGNECNAAYLLEQGWHGLLMDGAQSKNSRVHQEFITAENISLLFAKYQVPNEFDLLSIDMDGNDYWVWQAIQHRPRVVVIECNAHVPPPTRSVSKYDPLFRWNGSDYYGASLAAMQSLGQRKGYALVYCERTGTNAFFVANELIPATFVSRPIEEIFRPPNFLGRGLRHPPDRWQVMIPIHEPTSTHA